MHDRSDHKRLHGRRKGHALKPRQQRLVDTLLPRMRINVEQAAPQPLSGLFDHAPATIIAEIGFGGGEHLAAGAHVRPDAGFIGAEAYLNGVAKMLVEIDERSLDNVRLFDGDAHDLLAWLPDASLDRADMLYLDPWRKRRHWKRRFIGPLVLEHLARVLKPGAHVRFASDWPDYVTWTLMHMQASKAFSWIAGTADDWREPWPGWTRTRYEAKALREGRVPSYLTFARN